MVLANADEPIEIHLSDGGRVVVAFADAGTCLLASDQLIETILRTDGTEHDFERAIEDDLRSIGLTCTCSSERSRTLIVIG